jgi:Rrf2 family transcriptional regulator, nitric oxide-sensitive transcriptional repressor
MQLTTHTDYALRVLIYLTLYQDHLVTISELADFFHISRNHLVKVVHRLGVNGFIKTVRGKGGGICLARLPQNINVGAVVRAFEGHFYMAECFNPKKQGLCAVQPACGLTALLGNALKQYMAVLDGASLGELVAHTGQDVMEND